MSSTTTSETPAAAAPTTLIARAEVHSAERICPAFLRVTLASAAFADLAADGFDTRFKLILPNRYGELPTLDGQPESWYSTWSATPEDTRCPMRTYTIRDVVGSGSRCRLIVDLVVHDQGPQGPACRWALNAAAGDPVQVIAPHRGSSGYGGTEFRVVDGQDLLIAADETALPAVARILADVPRRTRGRAFVEVPTAADILDLDRPHGVDLTWLVRDGRRHGRPLVQAVRRALGLESFAGVADDLARPESAEPLWETARPDSELAVRGRRAGDRYAWIAGESWLVRALRRTLVAELGMDRSDVAFMGYWREGVAMRS